ncbi:MAG TPA: VWA domain-containing protein [Dongiaceae bacterium]|nr:VWA domain-containing protein [Dongiaceae bacterium]
MLYSLIPKFRLQRAAFPLRICGLLFCFCGGAIAQRQLPYLDAARNSPFTQIDLEEMYRQQIILDASRNGPAQGPLEPGTLSALDMQAPNKAVRELSRATSLLKEQKVKEAVHYLEKAIEIYPKFVSAHIDLGLAYFNLKDKRAKEEFETATKLDDQFPISYLYLGMMSLWSNDFPAADSSLEKAAFLSPNDPQILNALAFAQNGNHKYPEVLRTVDRIHRLEHHSMADVHYIAAAAAISLHEINSAQAQLNLFLREDPSGPLSPVARDTLDQLVHGAQPATPTTVRENSSQPPAITSTVTFPNSPRLQSELQNVASVNDSTDDSDKLAEATPPPLAAPAVPNSRMLPEVDWGNAYTIRKAVDETALFLAVSEGGKMVNDLSASEIEIRDDGKAPERILEFLPQSQLPLRLGMLIDTSGSVEHRITFEKAAAKKFIDRVLNPVSDLAFVAGFDTEVSVTQDFTRDIEELNRGVDNLGRRGEGTAVFDAVHYACWKLAAYPDQGRVARVLVVLTDGEDNSSNRSLKQAIEAAEASGITVYTFNPSESIDLQSDANRVLEVIAARSGGDSMHPRTIRDLEHFFEELSDAIRSRYLVAYKPAGFLPDGSYHRLKVTAVHRGKHLQVHVRKGYYARMAWNH